MVRSMVEGLNVAALVGELHSIVLHEDVGPEEKIRRICIALRNGGSNGAVFSRTEFLNFIAEFGEDPCEALITPGALGHWETGRRIITDYKLEAMLRTYARACGAGCLPVELAARLRLIRRQAEAERHKNKTLLASLFQVRDLPDLRHAGWSDPASEAGETYSYWLCDARNADRDLDDFVTLSDREEGIVSTHPSLTPHERRILYARWLRLSPQSFMTLRKYDPARGIAPVVAISIMLPLSQDGGDRIWTREVDAVGLNDADLGDGTSPRQLLVDTWIVKREERGRSGIDYEAISRRVDHEGFGGMLLPLHASLFWDGGRDIEILVEPAKTEIALMCSRFGFDWKKSETRDKDMGCYRLALRQGSDPALKAQKLLRSYVKESIGTDLRNTRTRERVR